MKLFLKRKQLRIKIRANKVFKKEEQANYQSRKIGNQFQV